MRFDATRWWAKTQFTDAVRVRLYRKIAKMLANGLPLLRILEVLRDRASHNGRKPGEPLAIVLDDCRRLVQNGRMLAEGLEWWAPKTERMILMAGAQSGHMETALLAVIDVVQAQRKIKAVIMAGIAYPMAILFLILVYIYMFGTKVIPEFTRIVDPSHWRGAAKSLYIMSVLVQDWMLPFVIVLVLALAGLVASLPRWRGDARIFFDRFAPFSIYRLVVGSGFLLAFSALQSAGVTVEKSLTRLSDLADPWLQERLDGALLGVRSGLNCGEALRNAGYGFPSDEVVDDLCVYAEYRGFGEALKLMADEWMEEGIAQVSLQMKILNGFSIATLAIVIGWLVTGFFGIQHEIATMTRAVH
ncbi:type II secretion system F family protein [Pseudoduganella namucuonensis]|uniref:Type II secretory pathway, component PulF n=1 Tax=Pseudoduganella namucuonensis TaxID=1035707 RepID=A0A1I7L7T8_9BURK|nr:type II secretion system F family protein [Pseudoduganella namucuonensis]SFV05781.1 Type II secretory pathway, component PulF [Pseudoduganella namucuonensis]